jgi:hypothetical protein
MTAAQLAQSVAELKQKRAEHEALRLKFVHNLSAMLGGSGSSHSSAEWRESSRSLLAEIARLEEAEAVALALCDADLVAASEVAR